MRGNTPFWDGVKRLSAAAEPGAARDRCLIQPERLSRRQTEAGGAASAASSASVDNGSGLKVELLNVQSLLPKLPDIRADLSQRKPDVACFTETNLKASTPDRFLFINGYNIFRKDQVIGRKKSGGGVIIYVRDHLQAEAVRTRTDPDIESHTESLWIKIKTDNKKAALLCCIYRPPSTNHRQIHVDFNDIEEQVQDIITAYPSQRLIISGDLNADSVTNPVAGV